MGLVDVVARAIFPSEEIDCIPGSCEDCDGMRENAKSAMRAMRQPLDADFGGKFGIGARELFTEMIDAALSEGDGAT